MEDRDYFDGVKEELIDIFEEVKGMVLSLENNSRAGLIRGLQELGVSPLGFIGAYYPVNLNIIVMNKALLGEFRKPNQKSSDPTRFTFYSTSIPTPLE